MKFRALYLLMFSVVAAHASVTVTVSPTGIATPTGAYIRVDIANCTNPTVVNSGTTIPLSRQYRLNNQSSVSITLEDNVTQIACNGNQLSYYTFTYVASGVQTLLKSAELPPGTFNLANLANLVNPPWNPGIIQGPPGVQGNDGTPGCIISSGLCTTVVATNPSASQYISQPPTTSITPNRENGYVYNVRAWCTNPAVLDQTCFSNAIADIVSHGYTGYAGHHYAELVVSPEIYLFSSTVTIPAGINIGIHGSVETGIYGSTINTDAADAFIVLSDDVDIKHISFFQTPSTLPKHNAITLGTSSVEVFDTHINWCWFLNQNYGIHAVNVSGLDISHNTWDSGTNYGFISDTTLGDVKVQNIIANSVRGFNQMSTFKIHGDGTDNYSDIIIDGIFDNTQAGQTAVDINGVRAVKISGGFNNNPYDVLLTAVNGGVIGPFIGHNNYLESIRVASSNNVIISNGSYTNVGLGQSGSGSLIDVTGSNKTSVSSISSLSTNGTPTGNVLHGLSIDGSSTGSSVFGNHFNAQTGTALNVLDTSTVLPVSSIAITGSLVNGTGLQHSRQAGCTTASPATSACSATITWPVPMANANYSWTCSGEGISGAPIINGATAKSSTSLTIQITNLTGVAASIGLLDCFAAHD